MSKIKIQGQSSGSGVYTLKTGTSSSNFDLTLPDVTGTVISTGDSATVTEAMVHTDAVKAFKSGRKNLIINGGMDVAQRGTTFTADGFSLDRWYHQLSGSTSTLTQEVFTTGSEVGGLTSYLKQAVATGNDYSGLVYKVEDVRSLSEGQATFSFYAKGTNPAGGNLQVRVLRMNTGSTTFDTPLDSTLTLTSSWQRFTYTFTVPTASGMTTPASDSKVYISIHQAAGDTGTAAWELNLTGVQLELGSVATEFEHRSYGEELALCQRYYERWSSGGVDTYVPNQTTLGFFTGGTSYFPIWFSPKRDTPSITVSGIYRGQGLDDTGNSTATAVSHISTQAGRIQMTASFSGTSGQCGAIQFRDSSSFIEIKAEL
jgi:hypothetical protein